MKWSVLSLFSRAHIQGSLFLASPSQREQAMMSPLPPPPHLHKWGKQRGGFDKPSIKTKPPRGFFQGGQKKVAFYVNYQRNQVCFVFSAEVHSWKINCSLSLSYLDNFGEWGGLCKLCWKILHLNLIWKKLQKMLQNQREQESVFPLFSIWLWLTGDDIC